MPEEADEVQDMTGWPLSHACQVWWSHARPKTPHHEECDGWAGTYLGYGMFAKVPRCYCLCHGHGGDPYGSLRHNDGEA